MTAVEWLINEMHKRERGLIETSYNHIFDQAKEMEKNDMEVSWNSSRQNMHFNFSSSAYKNITFKQWLEAFKREIIL